MVCSPPDVHFVSCLEPPFVRSSPPYGQGMGFFPNPVCGLDGTLSDRSKSKGNTKSFLIGRSLALTLKSHHSGGRAGLLTLGTW